MHEVLVNRLGGLSLPRKSVVRLTDRPDMTLDVYRGRKTTIQLSNKEGLLYTILYNFVLGSKCPSDGMTEPTACPDGEYQDSTQQTTCTACDAGHECSNKAAAPNPCAPGTYAAANAITCTACATGL